MKPTTLVLVAALLATALLVSGCTSGPSPAATPAATKAPAPGISSDDAKALEALLNTSVPDLPSLPDLSL